jgi:ERO1-like protein alpha
VLKDFKISTGNFISDAKARNLLNQILEISGKYGDIAFDESQLFKGEDKEPFKKQLKEYFLNITKIMDCVDCEKCKTWGKLQVKGLGTALKVIFDERYKSELRLNRNELIAFVNALTKWSTSIAVIPEMFEAKANGMYEVIRVSSFFLLLVIGFSKLLLIAHHKMVIKFSQRIKAN